MQDILVERLMAELQELLEQEKDNIETNRGFLELGKTPIENHSAEMHEPGKSQPETKMQLHNEENMAPITSCWNNLSEQVEERRGKACVIIWKLEDIEKVLRKMSASKRAVIQPCFSRLLADTDIIMNKITDYLKTYCDENQIRLTVRFRELATALQASS